MLANLRAKIRVGLREAGNVAEKEICPLLIEGCISVGVRVVERKRAFIAGAGILRFLIPVVLESELKGMTAAADGNVIKPVMIVVRAILMLPAFVLL